MQQSKGETEAFSTSFSSKYVSGIQVGHRKILTKKKRDAGNPMLCMKICKEKCTGINRENKSIQ